MYKNLVLLTEGGMHMDAESQLRFQIRWFGISAPEDKHRVPWQCSTVCVIGTLRRVGGLNAHPNKAYLRKYSPLPPSPLPLQGPL